MMSGDWPNPPIEIRSRASNAGGTYENKTWGSTQWKKGWYSQNEPAKYDDETRVNAPRWEYAKELKGASSNVRGMREITKREQFVTYVKKEFNRSTMLTRDRFRALA